MTFADLFCNYLDLASEKDVLEAMKAYIALYDRETRKLTFKDGSSVTLEKDYPFLRRWEVEDIVSKVNDNIIPIELGDLLKRDND